MADQPVVGASLADVDTEWLTAPLAEPWVRLTHRPSGITAEGRGEHAYAEALGALIQKLVTGSVITVNDGRRALGFPPFAEGVVADVLPQRQPLTRDEVRQLLRECVTVVKPGEILVLQPGPDVTPNQLREIQMMVNTWLAVYGPGIKALVVPGEAHQVVRQVPAGPFEPILPVPLDVDPDAPRPEPRRFQYHVGGSCPAPAEDGTCGCPPRAETPNG